LAESGTPRPAIAAVLRDRYGLNARIAMRLAHGWSQAKAAEAWNDRWPDDHKCFKNFSYWENWPSPTGHAPSLAVLDRLAQLYECDVADLLAGWGEHTAPGESGMDAEQETLAWQVTHLDLHELTRALGDWSQRLPTEQNQGLLLKLSTAAALAASTTSATPRSTTPTNTGARALEGNWSSAYRYYSTSRGAELEGTHRVPLRAEDGRLVGRSSPHPSGSELRLDLSLDGSLATGTWTERTSPTGHYRAATYHGVVQFVVDPTGSTMTGRWLGLSKRYTIKSGDWRLEREVVDQTPRALP
jgi:transcriptional regulator with XRE-family HTH domain